VLQRIAEVHPELIARMRVSDGDSFWAWMQLPLYRELSWVEFRLWGIDCPETRNPPGQVLSSFEKRRAHDAKFSTEAWFLKMSAKRILIETAKDPEKYNRWLARVWAEDHDGTQYHLNDHLIALELAVVSDGSQKWRQTYDRVTQEERDHGVAEAGRRPEHEQDPSGQVVGSAASVDGAGAAVL
jgi:endonuclease YncB( thermonuclease family)